MLLLLSSSSACDHQLNDDIAGHASAPVWLQAFSLFRHNFDTTFDSAASLLMSLGVRSMYVLHDVSYGFLQHSQ